MHFKYICLIASAALSTASPAGRRDEPGPGCNMPPPSSDPTLPKAGGDSELSGPPDGAKLKHIALGFGIQNYTCASEGADPKLYGALAMLFDATPLYPGQGKQSISKQDFFELTTKTVEHHDLPLNLNESSAASANRLDSDSPGASLVDPFPEMESFQLDGLPALDFIGHHFFTADGVPNFVVDDGAINFFASKTGSVPAPDDADEGPQGTGAVAWLSMAPRDGVDSVGATAVYRVLTAGGVGHKCTKAGYDSVPYSATYWFFG